MRSIVSIFRILVVFGIIFSFLAHMSAMWLVVHDRIQRMRRSNSLLSYYCRFALKMLGVRVTTYGAENLPAGGGALLVGNHLSYTDVLAISSNLPACFVTSMEIRRSPVLGQVCLLAGCLFVERRNKMGVRNEVSELRRGIEAGLSVAIFPEATSTNGEQVLRFRKPLFLSAIEAGRPVIPFCLNYRRVGGEPVTILNRDKVCWYGDMDFVPHLWSLVKSGGVELDLHFLPPIATSDAMDATELAERSQQAVAGKFIPVAPA